MTTHLFLGFDPGGAGGGSKCVSVCKGHFGWSICAEVDGDLERRKTGLANHAWDAVKQVNEIVGSCNNVSVRAAGIDAPLRVHLRRGNRKIDDNLREKLKSKGFSSKQVGGTVQKVNSLRGAATVQGGLLVKNLVEKTWAKEMITESHPKAFRHLVSCAKQPQVKKIVNCLTADLPPYDENNCQSGHELDATLCAIAAWAATRKPPLKNWCDLYKQEYRMAEDGTKKYDILIPLFQIPETTQLSYWMPMPR